MKNRLSKVQFDECTLDLGIGKQTLEIAYGVLVDGKSQVSFTRKFNITKGAVSQAVKRVWSSHLKKIVPSNCEEVSVILPKHQAFIANQWASKIKRDK